MSFNTPSAHPSPVKLPGFGLPLNFEPPQDNQSPHQGIFGELFPNAVDCNSNQLRLTTLREFTMMGLMNQITDKPDWDIKIFDDAIIAKWRSEALQTPDISEKMIDFCFHELRYKAKVFGKTGHITAYDGDVVKSDIVVPDELRAALKSAAAPLENVAPAHRDWHPGSDDIVLDLVHPSLFPVVYGKTRILGHPSVTLHNCVEQCGEGETLPIPSKARHYSSKFQWLPCQVEFGSDAGEVKITSYINNLHPRSNQDLYEVVEKIIAKAIPLWNRTLSYLNNQTNPIRIPFDGPTYSPHYDNVPEDEKPQQEDGEDEDDYWQRLKDWRLTLLVYPEPEDFVDPGETEEANLSDLRDEFAKTGLQVIVKLANIHLTPEKPEYAGGTWHVEGQLNEHICATALYYYDCANITESRLAFRQQSDSDSAMEMSYEQEDHGWLPEVFGCEQNEDSVQYVGDVLAKEGRLITFPNVFQHRVLPFKLEDPTKSGHRKILALFLVDPHIQIISSAHVPCQRRDWWAEEMERKHALPNRLPLELRQEVMSHVDGFPISLEEAKKLRLELMEERKGHNAWQDGKFHSETFNLCEH
ncbi:hypothetical protein FIBSPDRAFT_1050866 [Athelia psychrophila]|uniref:Uncharacterized protein n=1 Tax=Athelia psychrophila TaxID=1759441 RepID=A0A166A458_9AGAM|nr:hypothetical protein FIBSPDRAFT_1050866 [Fibularhizoctonia sp. CBS 109695]